MRFRWDLGDEIWDEIWNEIREMRFEMRFGTCCGWPGALPVLTRPGSLSRRLMRHARLSPLVPCTTGGSPWVSMALIQPVSGLTAPERKVGILYVRLLGLNSTYCPVLTHLWCTFIYDTHLWHISMTHTYDKPLHGSVFSKRAIYLHDVVCSGALPSSLDGII